MKKSELQQDVVIYKYEINEETTDTDMEYLKIILILSNMFLHFIT